MKVTTTLIALAVLSCPAVYAQDGAATVQTTASQADLVGTSYTLCVPRQDPVYKPGQAETCFEYHLREDGQAIRMFWIDRLDEPGLIENESMSHRAWTLDGGRVIIQGEQLRYGKDPILYYDVHEFAANGDLLWVRREVDEDGTTEVEDLTGDARKLAKDDPQGPAKFKAKMERRSGRRQPDEKKYVPEAYWREVVEEYPARYLRGS